ncbi:MAG: EFR1 family ferrodoxin [Candidatus Jordarchaeum sp.]|uniref:EFR1 family ferrodoxin n=1 Tax=Candidatus Jordarchaeum sp. TaxID=2823881 RepID=UPI00404B8F07
MKTLIIYFSQSGNTRKVAECIRNGVVDVTGQCDITDINNVDTSALQNYNLVGLGCPTHYYKEPFNVREFIDGLPELRNRQWFLFCTHGSIIANTFPSMAERLKKKGIMVMGYHDTYADSKMPYLPYPTLTTGHPDSLDLEEARSFGREVAERSQRITEGDTSLIPEPEPVSEEWVREAEMYSLELLERISPHLSINMDKCTLCHACQDNCPVKGIDIEADPPRIQTPCIYCFFCWKVCPTLAIEADWEFLATFTPEIYARLRRELDKSAAHGKFRWLIDPDSLSFDDPLYKQREREFKGEKQID